MVESPRSWGERVDGRYRLERRLGSGGMGDVWLAHDTRLDIDVALKFLKPEYSSDTEYVRRFDLEAQQTAELRGRAHVIPITDLGVDCGQRFLVMGYVPGKDLEQLLYPPGAPVSSDAPRRGVRLDPRRAVEIVAQVAEALEWAHVEPRGLVHRDIKPSNILICDDTGDVFLTDFGIVGAIDPTRWATLTQQGALVGTLAFMAPERLTPGTARANPLFDVYGLACVLFECLTGRRAFYVGPLGSAGSEPPRPSADVEELKPFDDVVLHGLAVDPGKRTKSARDLADEAREALEQWIQESERPTMPATRPGPPVPPVSVPPEPATLAVVVVLELGGDRDAADKRLNLVRAVAEGFAARGPARSTPVRMAVVGYHDHLGGPDRPVRVDGFADPGAVVDALASWSPFGPVARSPLYSTAVEDALRATRDLDWPGPPGAAVDRVVVVLGGRPPNVVKLGRVLAGRCPHGLDARAQLRALRGDGARVLGVVDPPTWWTDSGPIGPRHRAEAWWDEVCGAGRFPADVSATEVVDAADPAPPDEPEEPEEDDEDDDQEGDAP